MTWEQKFYAAQAIARDLSLTMRKPGDWFVQGGGLERKNDCVLESHCERDCSTPENAVYQFWQWILTCDQQHPIVINAMSENRREVFWNGFMWEDA